MSTSRMLKQVGSDVIAKYLKNAKDHSEAKWSYQDVRWSTFLTDYPRVKDREIDMGLFNELYPVTLIASKEENAKCEKYFQVKFAIENALLLTLISKDFKSAIEYLETTTGVNVARSKILDVVSAPIDNVLPKPPGGPQDGDKKLSTVSAGP